MSEKAKDKIQRLLALANDSNDEESMTALAKAQELMIVYRISEKQLFDYKEQIKIEETVTHIIYEGKPQKWVYRLAQIIAKNFRVKFYYESTNDSTAKLNFLGLLSDVEIAEITFMYAKGSISYCSKNYMKIPEVKQKYKRKWQLKQDYIQGYLTGLQSIFNKQRLTNGYELALQLPTIVTKEIENLGLISGKDISHTVKDQDAYYNGYNDGTKFSQKELIT